MPAARSTPAKLGLAALALAAGLSLQGCVVSDGPMVVTRPGPPQAYAYGYGSQSPYGWGAPDTGSWGHRYPGPQVYRPYPPAPPIYRGPQPRSYPPYAGPRYGEFRDPFYRPGNRRSGYYGNPYRNNGRCDDPRYETSSGGRAQPGTDEFDCSRYGNGLKGRYR